ncbi:hypothetical protein PIB30_036550 [Stylosanthes scabra]|uniref:Uncharacterized protein n=1 Tax=Stylosanthes scabra TaxID=79078 RepID=A0ABU6VFC3_9FABA|nr:hypothetical protein [Stylosanthes scabra]
MNPSQHSCSQGRSAPAYMSDNEASRTGTLAEEDTKNPQRPRCICNCKIDIVLLVEALGFFQWRGGGGIAGGESELLLEVGGVSSLVVSTELTTVSGIDVVVIVFIGGGGDDGCGG